MHSALNDHFRDSLRDALDRENLELDDLSRAYLLRLLVRFVERDALHCLDRDEPGTPALVWLYEEAQRGSRPERFIRYKRLGDVALFVSGFFNDHVECSPVGTDYYVDMGSAAYHRASKLSTYEHPVLDELAQKFAPLVEILMHVSGCSTSNLGRLYERLLRNPNSTLIWQQFIEQGSVPIFGRNVCG